MNITISCSKCGQKHTVDAALAGKRIKCKHCGGVIAIPVPRGQPAPPASSPRAVPTAPDTDPYGFLDDEPAAESELPRLETRSRSAARKRGNHGVWLVVGGAGALFVLIVGGLWLTNALRSAGSESLTQGPAQGASTGQPIASGQSPTSPTKSIPLPPAGMANRVASDPGPRPGPPPVAPIPNFQAATTPQDMARVQAKLES